MKYYNVTNARGVKLNHVLQCLFQKNMYPALHLRPSGARDFDPGDVLSRVAERKSCHTGVHR